MNIDWFTFAAQIVNFLVLVALLRWLLYDRIVSVMRKREEKIADRWNEADRQRKDAEEKARQYETKTHEFEEERKELIGQARREAQEQQQRLLSEARQEVEHKRHEWEETFRRERDDLVTELRREAGRIGVEAARHALAELADADLESRMWDAFTTRLRNLDKQQRDEIAHHLGNGEAEVLFRSAWDVPDEWRKRLRAAVRETFKSDAEISFEKSTALICGLELNVGGYSFGWNVQDFLSELELEFDERLQSHR